MFVVELEIDVWLAGHNGDPGRTTLLKNAKVYKTEQGARIALGLARRYRKFKDAKVIPLTFYNKKSMKCPPHLFRWYPTSKWGRCVWCGHMQHC